MTPDLERELGEVEARSDGNAGFLKEEVIAEGVAEIVALDSDPGQPDARERGREARPPCESTRRTGRSS